jgi:hypothetical protein
MYRIVHFLPCESIFYGDAMRQTCMRTRNYHLYVSTRDRADARRNPHAIIAGIVTLIGIIAFFVIRANNAARAGREIVDTVNDVRALKRKWDWQRNAGDGHCLKAKMLGSPRRR